MDYKTFINKILRNKDIEKLNKYKKLTEKLVKNKKLNKKYLLKNNIKLIKQNGGVLVKVFDKDKLKNTYEVITPYDPNIIIRVINSQYYISLEIPFTIDKKNYDVLYLENDINKIIKIVFEKSSSDITHYNPLNESQIKNQLNVNKSRISIRFVNKNNVYSKNFETFYTDIITPLYLLNNLQYLQSDSFLFILLFILYEKDNNINKKIINYLINLNIFYLYFETMKKNKKKGGGLSMSKPEREPERESDNNYNYCYILYFIYFNINTIDDIKKFLGYLIELDYVNILTLVNNGYNAYIETHISNENKENFTNTAWMGCKMNRFKDKINEKLKENIQKWLKEENIK